MIDVRVTDMKTMGASGNGTVSYGPNNSASPTSPNSAPAYTGGGAVARSLAGSVAGVAVVAAGFVIAL